MGEAFLGAVGRKRTLTLERHLAPAADIADDGWVLEGASPRLPNYLVDPGPPGVRQGLQECLRAPTTSSTILPTRCQHLAEAPHRAHLREPEGPAEPPRRTHSILEFQMWLVMYYKLYSLLASRSRLKSMEKPEYRGCKPVGSPPLLTDRVTTNDQAGCSQCPQCNDQAGCSQGDGDAQI